MKRLTLLFLLTLAIAGAAGFEQLGRVKRVYLVSMGNGLDQYLANRLTRSGEFQVVTTAADADAVFTDHLGAAFDKQMLELFPLAPKVTEKGKDGKDKDKDAEKPKEAKDDRLVVGSSFSRGKGNVFLVDRNTKAVLWSHYQRPKNSSPDEVKRTADKIVGRLTSDAKPKKQ
jgi:hypothetical protein